MVCILVVSKMDILSASLIIVFCSKKWLARLFTPWHRWCFQGWNLILAFLEGTCFLSLSLLSSDSYCNFSPVYCLFRMIHPIFWGWLIFSLWKAWATEGWDGFSFLGIESHWLKASLGWWEWQIIE
jgi:hypothetical protein